VSRLGYYLADGGGTFTGGVEGEQHHSDVMEVDCVTAERGEGRCVCVCESQAGGTRTAAIGVWATVGARAVVAGRTHRDGVGSAWAQRTGACGRRCYAAYDAGGASRGSSCGCRVSRMGAKRHMGMGK
jgi:hypothetical protein